MHRFIFSGFDFFLSSCAGSGTTCRKKAAVTQTSPGSSFKAMPMTGPHLGLHRLNLWHAGSDNSLLVAQFLGVNYRRDFWHFLLKETHRKGLTTEGCGDTCSKPKCSIAYLYFPYWRDCIDGGGSLDDCGVNFRR